LGGFHHGCFAASTYQDLHDLHIRRVTSDATPDALRQRPDATLLSRRSGAETDDVQQ
jgi:hypothetical protein